MNPRLVSVAVAALAAALVPTLAAYAKDDPAKVAADRETMKKEYSAAKKYLFQDMSYVVDSTKLKDTRWEVQAKIEQGPDPDQGVMFYATFPSGNPTVATPSIKFRVYKCIGSDSVKKTEYSKEFKAWGKTIKVSDTKHMAEGYYWDWTLQATDLIKAKCHVPDKKNIGVAEWWGCAVGTDKESKQRVKMDWYIWTNNSRIGTWFWNVEAETADKFIDVKEWPEKLDDLMKNIVEVTDPRAHLK